FELPDGRDLVDLALAGFAVEPGEKARHRQPVAHMRRPRTFDLGRVLDRFRRDTWVGSICNPLAQRPLEPPRRRVRIKPYGFAGIAQSADPLGQIVRRADLGDGLEVRSGLAGYFLGQNEKLGLSALRNDCEGQRYRIMRNVRATDVERPRDAVR